ncbi:MAG: hypothetical protein JXB03_10415 [Spirochaetales bacterium]|nr:hypothetical protein [Spirochaetales bacterium]
MINAHYQFEHFYTRDGFNSSLGHFQAVSDIVGQMSGKTNLADLLNEELEEGSIRQNQISPIVYALLVDKFKYAYGSVNLKDSLEEFATVHQEVSKWDAVDLVGTYIHPELGFLVFNPKNIDHLKALQNIKKNEIVTIYVGALTGTVNAETSSAAVECFLSILSGKKKNIPPSLLKGSFKYSQKTMTAVPRKTAAGKSKKPTQAKNKAASVKSVQQEKDIQGNQPGPRRMTPLYSVPVTNELFHNGNVEAWKRIIKSYTTKHPQLEVYIFYEGERIHDINALFKWGKVKHGSAILFAVSGEDVKDVAKLQRYLMQGASPRFEDFLRFPVNTVLNLF